MAIEHAFTAEATLQSACSLKAAASVSANPVVKSVKPTYSSVLSTVSLAKVDIYGKSSVMAKAPCGAIILFESAILQKSSSAELNYRLPIDEAPALAPKWSIMDDN